MTTSSRAATSSAPPQRKPRQHLIKAGTAVFAMSLLCGWLTTGSQAESQARSDTRIVVDSPPAISVGDDHGHNNPILELDIYLDQVRQDKSGREVLDFDVAITARANFDYDYQTRIEDDRGRPVKALPSSPRWALASGKSAVHPFSVPKDLGPGFYKTIIKASASGPSGNAEEARSVFFQVDSKGNVIPMDRIDWLDNSEAALGTQTPAHSKNAR